MLTENLIHFYLISRVSPKSEYSGVCLSSFLWQEFSIYFQTILDQGHKSIIPLGYFGYPTLKLFRIVCCIDAYEIRILALMSMLGPIPPVHDSVTHLFYGLGNFAKLINFWDKLAVTIVTSNNHTFF